MTGQLTRVATVGVVGLPLAYALNALLTIAVWQQDPAQRWWAAAATLVYGPLLALVLVRETGGQPLRRRGLFAVAVVLAVAAATPKMGTVWAAAYFAPVTVVALMVHPAAALAVCGGVAYRLSTASQSMASIAYTLKGIGIRSGSLLILLWIVKALRALGAARDELAASGVVAQRQEADDLLRRSVGAS